MLRFQDLTEVKELKVLLVQLVPAVQQVQAVQMEKRVQLEHRVCRVLSAQPVFKEQQVGIVMTYQGEILDRSML